MFIPSNICQRRRRRSPIHFFMNRLNSSSRYVPPNSEFIQTPHYVFPGNGQITRNVQLPLHPHGPLTLGVSLRIISALEGVTMYH